MTGCRAPVSPHLVTSPGETATLCRRYASKPLIAALCAMMVSAIMAYGASAAGRHAGGLWTKTTHPDPGNLAIFYIDRQAARVIGYGQISGKPALWYAEGTYTDGLMRLTYRYSEDTLPEGWARQGSMQLELSEDGNRMTGEAIAASGRWSGRVAFKRIGVPVE
ncbi:MAG TPA: hypothetical protein VLT88_08895 [Desulfosarcina sp.]|nr:hypothetical protein [Desulfosarcina sp.]